MSDRRTFLKSAVATGIAATGLTAFGGTAAAQGAGQGQTQQLQIDADNLVVNDDFLSISLENISVDVLEEADVNILSAQGQNGQGQNGQDSASEEEQQSRILQTQAPTQGQSLVDVEDVYVLSDNVVAISVQDVLNNANVDVTALNNVTIQLNVLTGDNNLLTCSETVNVAEGLQLL